MTQPPRPEAQHIGTFWVINLNSTDPYMVGAGLAPALDRSSPSPDRLPPALDRSSSSPDQLSPALDRLPPSSPNIAPRIPAAFMRVGPEVAQELAHAMDPDDTELVLQRFARGCQCYAGRVEGKLVTYGWVTFDEESIGELGMSFHLQAGEAYIWDCATLPAFRGQRLYPALLTFMLDELYRSGIRRIWIGADVDNLPSQSGFTLAGFTPVVDILLARDLTTHRAWVRGRPGVPEELVANVRRALNIGASASPEQ